MSMKRLIVVCAWLAVAAAASSCEGDGVGPATSPINPFGSEPSTSTVIAGEPPTAGGSLASLCARACAHIESVCPGSESPNCANDCATSSPPGCEAQFRAFVQCIATAPFQCNGSSIDPTPCLPQLTVLDNCDNGSGMAGGGTGSGGTAGTAPPR